jgi:hypothetical protein
LLATINQFTLWRNPTRQWRQTVTNERYLETTSSLARRAGVLPETVRLYGKLGLIESVRLPNGALLYPESAADQVMRVYRERMARRGGSRAASRPA